MSELNGNNYCASLYLISKSRYKWEIVVEENIRAIAKEIDDWIADRTNNAMDEFDLLCNIYCYLEKVEVAHLLSYTGSHINIMPIREVDSHNMSKFVRVLYSIRYSMAECNAERISNRECVSQIISSIGLVNTIIEQSG